MIEKISVTNFKSHAHTEIELGRVTALVGPNGCGKTAILQAAHCLTLLAERNIGQIFHGNLDFGYIVRHGYFNFQILVNGQGLSEWLLLLKTILEPKSDDHYFPSEWHSTVDWRENSETGSSKLERNHSFRHTSVPKFLQLSLGITAYFKPVFTRLAAPSIPTETSPQIAFDGSGLASVIRYLMTFNKEQFESIQIALKEIVPTVKEIRVGLAKIEILERKSLSINTQMLPYDEPREVIGDELVFDTTSAKDVPAHAMSEGTLLVLGLLTLIIGPNSPNLILLDDIEQGLHPLAQRLLMKTLKILAEKYNKQILLTSHSPYIVDELEAKDVWVMTTDKEGTSHCKRLSDHHDAKRLLEVLTTGEFGGAVGEDWVIPNESLAEVVNA